jgi:hypothetical protein
VQKEKDSASSRLAANLNQAVLYVRVFSKAQEVGYSLDAQEKLGDEYCQKKNLKIVKRWKVSESAWRSAKFDGDLVDGNL